MPIRRAIALVLSVALVATCSGGRSASGLSRTPFGEFVAPSGSAFVQEFYDAGGFSGELVDCATLTRIFGTNDTPSFRDAVYAKVRSAGLLADNSEGEPIPLEGTPALVFRSDHEIVELGFWRSEQLMRIDVPVPEFRFDWTAYDTIAVLKVTDVSTSCSYALQLQRPTVVGRVADALTGAPLAGVRINVHFTASEWLKAQDKSAAECTGSWTLQPDGRCETVVSPAMTGKDGIYAFQTMRQGFGSPIRVSFQLVGYKETWWRNASTWAEATDIVTIAGSERRGALGIDAKMEH